MNTGIWSIWSNIDFLIPTVAFIATIMIAIYFEWKYLTERKKNRAYYKNSQGVKRLCDQKQIKPIITRVDTVDKILYV